MDAAATRVALADTDTLRAHFDAYGFVVVSTCVGDDVLASLTDEYARLCRTMLGRAGLVDAPAPDEPAAAFISRAVREAEAVDHELVARLYDTSAMCPAFLRLVSDPLVVAVASTLLGTDGVLYPFTNRIRIDPPQDERRTYGWHQEVFYTLPRSRFVQTWAPLFAPTTRVNGTIWVAEGSHRLGIPQQRWDSEAGRALQVTVPESALTAFPQYQVEMIPGEMLFFSGNLFHRSGRNSSTDARFSLVGMYHDSSAPPFAPPSLDYRYRGQTPEEYFVDEMGAGG